jgi:hypothetical protein
MPCIMRVLLNLEVWTNACVFCPVVPSRLLAAAIEPPREQVLLGIRW